MSNDLFNGQVLYMIKCSHAFEQMLSHICTCYHACSCDMIKCYHAHSCVIKFHMVLRNRTHCVYLHTVQFRENLKQSLNKLNLSGGRAGEFSIVCDSTSRRVIRTRITTTQQHCTLTVFRRAGSDNYFVRIILGLGFPQI